MYSPARKSVDNKQKSVKLTGELLARADAEGSGSSTISGVAGSTEMVVTKHDMVSISRVAHCGRAPKFEAVATEHHIARGVNLSDAHGISVVVQKLTRARLWHEVEGLELAAVLSEVLQAPAGCQQLCLFAGVLADHDVPLSFCRGNGWCVGHTDGEGDAVLLPDGDVHVGAGEDAA